MLELKVLQSDNGIAGKEDRVVEPERAPAITAFHA